jgi:hypothetical protein
VLYLLIKSGNAIRLAHERVLVPSIGFRLVAVKPLVLDRCERGVTIRRWHNRFGKDPMRLGTGVTKVRIPVVICRADGPDEGVVSVPKSVFVFLLAH